RHPLGCGPWGPARPQRVPYRPCLLCACRSECSSLASGAGVTSHPNHPERWNLAGRSMPDGLRPLSNVAQHSTTCPPMHLKRLEYRILKAMNRASRDFDLLAPHDRILVALSGGKDSYAMLWGLQKLQAAAPFPFELVAYH